MRKYAAVIIFLTLFAAPVMAAELKVKQAPSVSVGSDKGINQSLHTLDKAAVGDQQASQKDARQQSGMSTNARASRLRSDNQRIGQMQQESREKQGSAMQAAHNDMALGIASGTGGLGRQALNTPGTGGGALEAAAFNTLRQVTADMNEDLKMAMAEVKAANAAKGALRDQLARIKKETDRESLRVMVDQMQQKLDEMSGMTERAQSRLKMAMDRRSKMNETLSNLQKKHSDTQGAITKNLK